LRTTNLCGGWVYNKHFAAKWNPMFKKISPEIQKIPFFLSISTMICLAILTKKILQNTISLPCQFPNKLWVHQHFVLFLSATVVLFVQR